MKNKQILVIDETIREGMQHRGLMFNIGQRLRILEFQEKLGIDICQAGYPPAHDIEADTVRALFNHAIKNRYKIRIAAMGRANINDAETLLATGVNDLHFHVHIKNDLAENHLDKILHDLSKTIDFVRTQNFYASISIAMLDIGRSDDRTLEKCILFLSDHKVDILSLPDTSGMMAPNQVFEKISRFSPGTGKTDISIHCHNDMGMASANSIMGILAGGRVLEASALGIGERNGIADLYTSVKILKDQGFAARLNTDDVKTFKAYYKYVDSITYEQTGSHLLTVITPMFGDAVKTHVAGTHAGGEYGIAGEEQFFLNVLCGRNLVKKYLNSHKIACPENLLDTLTMKIKSKSARLNKRLSVKDVTSIISSLQNLKKPSISKDG